MPQKKHLTVSKVLVKCYSELTFWGFFTMLRNLDSIIIGEKRASKNTHVNNLCIIWWFQKKIVSL